MIRDLLKKKPKDRRSEGLTCTATFNGVNLYTFDSIEKMPQIRLDGFILSYKHQIELGLTNENIIEYAQAIRQHSLEGNREMVGVLSMYLEAGATGRTSEQNIVTLADWFVLLENEPLTSKGEFRNDKLDLMRNHPAADVFFLQKVNECKKVMGISMRQLDSELKIIRELRKLEGSIMSYIQRITLEKP